GLATVVPQTAQRCLRECGDGAVALQADDPPSGGVRGDERIAAEPEGRVENCVAWAKARVRDDRIHLAPGGAQHAQHRHACAWAGSSAVEHRSYTPRVAGSKPVPPTLWGVS